MAIQPDTDIRLIKSPLTLSNKHQLTFADVQAQANYFLSLDYVEDQNASYQRKDNVIRFNSHIDNIIMYNYCMYKNNNYSNKWFYAFITSMRYINDSLTEVSIVTDVFQTWQFDLKYKNSFVEREIVPVSSDVAGNYLIPEGLEFGELKVEAMAEIDDLDPVYMVAYSGDAIGSVPINQDGFSYNGIPSSITFIMCNNIAGFQALLNTLNASAQGDKVVTCFTVPKIALKDRIAQNEPDPSVHYYYYDPIQENYQQTPVIKNLVSLPSTLDGYTPRNQKLRTYPYLYLGFNPQNGSSKIYRYEDFLNGTPSFKIISEINPNPIVQFIPQNYRGASGDSLSDNATMCGYPTLSYKTDVFNVWLAQNSETISLQMQQEQFNYNLEGMKAIGGLVENIATAGLAGYNMDASGAYGALKGTANSALDIVKLDKDHEFYVKNVMAQIEKQKLLPDNVSLSSSNATLLGYQLMNDNIFTRYSIKREFAERIDQFFDMYGYTVNELKNININSRPNWNYIKTRGANILGNIPQYDLQTIKEMFDNGVTFWHNPATFLDYSQNNR